MDPEKRYKLAGALAMVGTASLWSIAGILIKLIDWNPFAIAGMRSFIASIVILIYIRRPIFTFSFSQMAAAISYAVTMILFVTANKTTTAANAVLLQYTAPVITAFLAVPLLNEKTKPEHWFAIFFVGLGMIIMFIDDLGGGRLLGNSIALMSAFSFSLYFIFLRMQKDSSPFESVILSHWITAIGCLIASLFMPLPHITLKSATAMLILGAIQMGIPSILISIGIKRISALSANLIAVIEPVFNPIWVFLFVGETPGVNTIIGGSLIIISVTAVSVISARRR